MPDTLDNSRRAAVISGPMTGLPNYNMPAFDAAEARLRALGYTVIHNPATLSRSLGLGQPWGEYLGRGLEAMRIMRERFGAGVDLIQLPGWRESDGAALEFALAQRYCWRCVSLDGEHSAFDVAFGPLPGDETEAKGKTDCKGESQ